MLSSLPQLAVMSAVVATLMYLPVGIAVAMVFGLFGFSLESVVTFGGALNIYSGLFAWWLLVFGGACIYAACAFPWEEKVL
jgi:hypothetical protein